MFNAHSLWYDLRNLVYEKIQEDEVFSWEQLQKLMEEMEFEQNVKEATCIPLDTDEMELAINLERFAKENGPNCYDYIEYIDYKKEKNVYIVGIFTEPVGIIGFEGEDLKALLSNIYNLYSSQPTDMSYIIAGHTLNDLHNDLGHPLTFGDKIIDIDSIWKKENTL